jgi:hypothetical protein
MSGSAEGARLRSGKSGGPANGALISATLRNMSGRTSAHHAATEAPKSCPITAATRSQPSAATSPAASRTALSRRNGARSSSKSALHPVVRP